MNLSCLGIHPPHVDLCDLARLAESLGVLGLDYEVYLVGRESAVVALLLSKWMIKNSMFTAR
jgi:hypothetical protein